MNPYLRWSLVNGAQFALLTTAMMGVVGAMNLLQFAIVALFIVGVIVTLAVHSGSFPPLQRTTPIPLWIDKLVDLIFVGVLAWFGHGVLATLYLVTFVLCSTVFKDESKK